MPLLIFLLKIVHWAIVIYILTGWMVASAQWLGVYLVLVPIIVIHWRLNDNSCIINNIETLLITGKWRNESNPEEGGFVHTSFLKVFGWAPPARVFDQLIYVLMSVFWAAAYIRWRVM